MTTDERWTFRRKAELVENLAAGRISPVDVAEMGISDEELAEWQRLYAEAGIKGLRATQIVSYRRARREKK